MDYFEIEGTYVVPEQWWTESGEHPEKHASIQEDIREIFGSDSKSEINETGIGIGAGFEAILAIISIAISSVGGIPGIIDLGKQMKSLRDRWSQRSGGTILYPCRLALPISLTDLFTQKQLENVRLVIAKEIRVGPREANIGDVPIYYMYAIGIMGEDVETDELHVFVTNESGDVILYQDINEALFLSMWGDSEALEGFVFGMKD